MLNGIIDGLTQTQMIAGMFDDIFSAVGGGLGGGAGMLRFKQGIETLTTIIMAVGAVMAIGTMLVGAYEAKDHGGGKLMWTFTVGIIMGAAGILGKICFAIWGNGIL